MLKNQEINSFQINHMELLPGVYVSKIDSIGTEILTTFDLRLTRPNFEPVMNTAEIHTIEHLGAFFLRNDEEWKDKTIYFGPMGCRTGFYMILKGDYSSEQIVPLVEKMFEFIANFEGEIPGAQAKSCGNYLDMNLGMAHYWAYRYLQILQDMRVENLYYPIS